MINEKIREILESKHMSPSRFADEIGVQRSSISHILSGRNKPSLDIIVKIARRFPEIGTDWILDADEESEDEDDTSAYIPPKQSGNQQAISKPAQSLPLNAVTLAGATGIDSGGKKVERIIVFYSDHTFVEYRPE